MGILNFFKKDPRANHTFDEKDRELSAERRRMNIELENLKKKQEMERMSAEHALKMAEIQAEMDELFGEDEGYQGQPMSPEDALAYKLIDKIGDKKPTSPTPTAGAKAYSDAELSAKWAEVPPAHKALVPKCNDEQIKEYVQKQLLPDADQDTLNRCVRIARSTIV